MPRATALGKYRQIYYGIYLPYRTKFDWRILWTAKNMDGQKDGHICHPKKNDFLANLFNFRNFYIHVILHVIYVLYTCYILYTNGDTLFEPRNLCDNLLDVIYSSANFLNVARQRIILLTKMMHGHYDYGYIAFNNLICINGWHC